MRNNTEENQMNDLYGEKTEITVIDTIEEPVSGYNKHRDFTTLKAWKNAREVKLFFYNYIRQKTNKK